MYEDENISVRPSAIEGLGVFAKRFFKKGEIVLTWNPKKLTPEELEALPKDQKRYINKAADGDILLMQSPERFVNSSQTPNTETSGWSDIALRDIESGEEITSNYSLD